MSAGERTVQERIDQIRPVCRTGLGDEDLAQAYRVPRLPWVRVNFVTSLDGSATRGGRSGGLSDGADRRVFALLRRLCDVVAVGSGTIRAEGYGGMRAGDAAQEWRLAHGLAAQPRLAVISNRLLLEPDAAVFTQAVTRPLVITSDAAPAERRRALGAVADVIVCGTGRVDPALAVEALVGRGLPRILCEGGPSVFAAFAAAGVVDELCLTLTSTLVAGAGPRILRAPEQIDVPLRLGHVLTAGDTLLLRYERARDATPAHGGAE